MGRFPKAKKHLGQNFLHSPSMLTKLIHFIQVDGGRNFLEIGPGTGAMTKQLNAFADKLLVVEIDKDMIKIIEEIVSLHDVVKLNESFLNLQEDQILDHLPTSYNIVGNLPYYITSSCIEHVLLSLKHWSTAYFMVQKEVAHRILAKPHSKDYGRLTVFCQLLAKVKLISNVPRGCFQPVPNVDSSFIKFTRNPPLDKSVLKHTLDLVKTGFSQRRKQLHGLLKKSYPGIDWQTGMNLINLKHTSRAENLTIDQWVKLAYWSSNKAC